MTLAVERIQPAFDGVNTEAAPDYLGRTEAPVVDNLIPRPGALVMRGPIQWIADYPQPLANSVWGYGPWLSQRTGYILLYPGSGSNLWQANENAWFTLPIADTTQKIGPRYVDTGAYVYGLTAFSQSPNSALVRWDGDSSVVSYANAPGGSLDITTHLQRLFVLGGSQPGSAIGGAGPYYYDRLYYSDLVASDTALPDTAAAWQDDVSGLVNQIVLDNHGDDLVGLAAIRAGLVIFGRNSIYLLAGRTPAQFELRVITREMGCTNTESICVYEESVVFMSGTGLKAFDGYQFTDLSVPRNSELIGTDLGLSNTGGVRVQRLENNYLLVIAHRVVVPPYIPGRRPAINPYVPITARADICALVQMPTGRWFNFYSDALANKTPFFAVPRRSTTHAPRLFDINGIYDAPSITVPERLDTDVRGFDQGGPRGDHTIPASLRTRLAKLALPTNLAQIKRVLIDYSFVRDSSAGAGSGWTVSVVDGRGEPLLDGTATLDADVGTGLPAAGTPPSMDRKRAQFDMYSDASDVQLQIQWPSAAVATAVEKAVIYDSWIEYAATRQRTNV